MRVTFGITDPDAISNSNLSTVNTAPFSTINGVLRNRHIDSYYDTLEHNKFILSNTKHVLGNAPYGLEQGYVSNAISDVNCNLPSGVKLVVNYDEIFKFPGFNILFDQITGEYVSEIKLTLKLNGVQVYQENFTGDSNSLFVQDMLPDHNYAEIEFLKTSAPYKRVRVSALIFGLTTSYDDSSIVNAREFKKVDILSSILPVNSFEFSFLDVDNTYNPENPSGLYQYLEQLQRVEYEFGYRLEDDSIEWIKGGTLVSNGQVNFDSGGVIPKVTIKADNVLLALSDIYYGGVIGSVSFGSILTAITPEGFDLEYDSELDLMFTTAPCPKDSIRNIYQMIANATGRTLSIDRNGVIRIEKLDLYGLYETLDNYLYVTLDDYLYEFIDNQSDFYLTRQDMYTVPTVSKLPPLRNLTSAFYTLTPETVTTEIASFDINSPVAVEFKLEHNMASETSLSFTGTLSVVGTPQYFAETVIVTLAGNGTVKVMGKKVNKAETILTKSFSLTGLDCNLRNPMITTKELAQAYVDWVGAVLILKNEYMTENRGYPELDPMDRVYIDTLYSTKVKSLVTENEIVYNGAIVGKSKLIMLESG
jgi:hypothetical protein